MLSVGKGTGLAAILNIDAFEEGDYLVMLTKNGLIKRTPLKAFTSVRNGGLTAIKLKVDTQHAVSLLHCTCALLCAYIIPEKCSAAATHTLDFMGP